MPPATQLTNLDNIATATSGAVAHDFSLWNLFLSADIIVQLVMIWLFLASFWSWTIIFTKAFKIKALFSAAGKFEEAFWSGGSLDTLFERIGNHPQDPMSAVFVAAMREWKRSSETPRSIG